MSKIGELPLVLALAFASVGRAEPPTALGQLSPVERQQSDFYGAIAGTGPPVAVAWSLGAQKVSPGGDIELTLTVKNAVNPAELARPNLADRSEWKEMFGAVLDLPGRPAGEFRYRLRPRNPGRFELPIPKYRYYNPRLPDGRRFQVAFAQSPVLVVEPPGSIVEPSVRIPLVAPTQFFEELPSAAEGSESPPPILWWALLAAGVLAPPARVATWRRRNPDAARLAKIRRAKAVRAALDGLEKAERSSERAEYVAKIALRYLRERWRVPPSAQTPGEVTRALRTEGIDPDKLGEVEWLLKRCDEARFAPVDDNGVSLAVAARSLIVRWEGATA